MVPAMEPNKEQKLAVEHDEGPLLIIAGAGTGKTHVITSRIINLIAAKKAKPSEILALTFNEKAATEMLTRVDTQMPYSYEEICIKTFHAFAQEILKGYGLEIGIDPGFKILDEVKQWFFFKKHIFDFELDYYRPLGNPNRFIYDILHYFGKLKDELVTPEKFLEYAEKLSGSGSDKADEAKKTLEVAKTYKRYHELKIANNYLDFGDLIYYALQLLEKRPGILKDYQERFKYLLVDEFQDTNYAQFQLVLKIAEKYKNIVVVGDDDQSIYKWRGASLSNILQFEKHFPAAKKVVLTENYRSPQTILDGSYALIQNNNPDRLEVKIGVDKELKSIKSVTAANDKADYKDSPIEVHHFPNFIQEIEFVAQKINEIVAAKKGSSDDSARYKDFAVLVRSHSQEKMFVDEFKLNGIPYQVKNPRGLLSLEEIKDLVAVARVLANPYDDISLLRMLKIPLFNITMEEILKLMNNHEKDHLFDAIRKHEKEDSLPGLESGVKKVGDILLSLMEFSKNKPADIVLAEFMSEIDLLKTFLQNDKIEEVQNIETFGKQIKKFVEENDNNSIIDFVDYIGLLEESNAALPTADFNDYDAVQIASIHSAKGLEFDYVFVANLVNQRFPSGKHAENFTIPEELTNEIYPEGDVHIEEERRLMYVAMTRAKENLFLTFSDKYEGNKKWKMSPFLKEILDAKKAKLIEHEEKENALEKLKKFKEFEKPIFNLPPFKSSKISHSQVDTFKTCPLKYNYRYLMKVPVPPSHAANFGNSVHGTMKDVYRMLKDGKKIDFDAFMGVYEKNWIPYGYESKEHEKIQKEKGYEMLKTYYDQNANPWKIPTFIEKPFNLKIHDFWLNGRIDRIDKLADGTYEVIDYKTGRLSKSDEKYIAKNQQLSIYALAARDVFGIKVSKLTLYYLEDNKKISTTRSDDDLNELPDELWQVFKEMELSDFSPTPGFWCQFCDFRIICPAV